MPIQKLLAIVLIVAGVMGLVYGGFSFTRETHQADFGPLSLSVDEEEYVTVPIWAGLGAIVIGVSLLLFRKEE
ncbi:MAG: hypothetical protein WD558_03405 [Pseudomonadales bacterium]